MINIFSNLSKSGDVVQRMSADAHPPGFLNDDKTGTYWLLEPTLATGGNASASPAVTLEVALGDSFQMFFIYVQFYGAFPYTLTIERLLAANNSYVFWQQYSLECGGVKGYWQILNTFYLSLNKFYSIINFTVYS